MTAPDSAAEKLRLTMEQSDDPELAMVARLRLARVLAYREQYQEALALLNVPEPAPVRGPHRRDQRRHPRGARRDGCRAHGLSRSDGVARRGAARSRLRANEARGLARRYAGAGSRRRRRTRSRGHAARSDDLGRSRRSPAGRGACRSRASRRGRVRPTLVRVALCTASLCVLGACAGSKDTAEPPADLQPFEATLDRGQALERQGRR